MLYLAGQIFSLLMLTAGLFFALGTYFQRRFKRPARREPLPRPISIPTRSAQNAEGVKKAESALVLELRTRIQELEAESAEKDQALRILASAPPSSDASPTEAEMVREAQFARDEVTSVTHAPVLGEGDADLEFDSQGPEEAQMLDKMTALQSALEAQGGILENKSAALEKAKGQAERLKDENEFLQSKVQRLEEALSASEAAAEELARAVPEVEPAPAAVSQEVSDKVDSLWESHGETQWNAQVEDLEGRLAAQTETIQTLTQLSEEREREVQDLRARIEELTHPSENEVTRPDISLEAMQAFWQPADSERMLAEKNRIEAVLKAQIQNLENELAERSQKYEQWDERWAQHLDQATRALNEKLDALAATVAASASSAAPELEPIVEPFAEMTPAEAPSDFEMALSPEVQDEMEKVVEEEFTPRLTDDPEIKERLIDLQNKLQTTEESIRQGESQLQDRLERKLDQMQAELVQMENLLKEATDHRREVPERFLEPVHLPTTPPDCGERRVRERKPRA